ncbi:MAG TPA: 5-carboxymethyl-2-hydroxymuconate Delta-isomerase [Woeseiaceae bacterium]|nr:5-carboxymethyl-2-hydroxymuconate Delta-isomerase [Woeseiaceae bacterium]
MPHLTIEYSSNLDAEIDIGRLVAAMHESAIGIEALPIGGIRTRAVRRDFYEIADGHPDNTFINVTLRIAEGRSLDVRKRIGETLFRTLRTTVNSVYEKRPMALSLEIQEIDPETRWKQGNIREYMARRSN